MPNQLNREMEKHEEFMELAQRTSLRVDSTKRDKILNLVDESFVVIRSADSISTMEIVGELQRLSKAVRRIAKER